MHRLDPSNASCFVFTFKEGLLSLVAHDLKIRVTRFSIDVDEAARAVAGRFDATSLRVACAMNGDEESPGTLSDAQKSEIEANIVNDVLATAEFPEIRFASTSVKDDKNGFRVAGDLLLHGVSKRVALNVERNADGYVAHARVHQPDFGIRPYSALFGTLKVKAEVEIRVVVPWATA